MKMIRSGTVKEAVRKSGEWLFIDIGFSSKKSTCGYAFQNEEAQEITFAKLKSVVCSKLVTGNQPLNLVIEAPLSVAFNSDGNPIGRAIEKQGKNTRYWYVGLGCSVLVATMYLIRGISSVHPQREIRLFEGFASFKEKGVKNSHRKDVSALRRIVFAEDGANGSIVASEKLAQSTTDELIFAFSVLGLNFGIPPVIVVNG